MKISRNEFKIIYTKANSNSGLILPAFLGPCQEILKQALYMIWQSFPVDKFLLCSDNDTDDALFVCLPFPALVMVFLLICAETIAK